LGLLKSKLRHGSKHHGPVLLDSRTTSRSPNVLTLREEMGSKHCPSEVLETEVA